MTQLSKDSIEFILVHTPNLSETYTGLKGTFSTLVDGCIRKASLPGFYEDGLIKAAELKGDSLRLVLSGERTDADLLSALGVAIRNVGGFPSQSKATDVWMVEVKSEIEK